MAERLTAKDHIGTTLAGYRIDALLGRGGMSVVYLAGDLALGRKVALKLGPGADLYWLPLGAGGYSVQLNGRFEAVAARLCAAGTLRPLPLRPRGARTERRAPAEETARSRLD